VVTECAVPVLLALVAAPLLAQQPAHYDAGVAKAMLAAGSKYVPPACSADKNKHFKVSSGATYLKTAIETPDSANKARALSDAERVITEAITQNGQDKSAAAWYFLGRTRLYRGDIQGADTALTKALKLAPDCKDEIANLTRPIFAAYFNNGVDAYKAGKDDEAIGLFRQAAAANPGSWQPDMELGNIFYNQQKYDSAAAYYRKMMSLPVGAGDSATVLKSQKYYGFSLLQGKHAAEAVAPLRTYLAANPDDIDAKKALANAYNATGKADSAAIIQKELLAPGGDAGGGGAAASDAMTIGLGFYKNKKYQDAVTAFERVLASNPNSRDALYYEAFAYDGLGNGAKLVETAKRLLAIDPLSEDAHKLLGEGYKLQQNDKARQDVALELLAMPVAVQINDFAPSTAGVTLTGTASGREALTKAGTPVKPTPVTLTVEFLDAKGTAVTSQDIAIPALTKGQTKDFTAEGKGSGIIAWRYKTKA
jgi:tetratricopeptide (TPR) repeat protein